MDIAASMADRVGIKGPAERTLLLVLHSGPVGGMLSSTLQPDCVEGLLSYARLFFAQTHAGKLSTLAAAGRRVHTVTSWDPGQQSVEAIVQGLADWKAPEGDAGFSIKHTLKEVTRFLFQSSGTNGVELAAADKAQVESSCEAVPMLRIRLVVILPQDSGAGSGIHVYHKYMVEAVAGVSTKETDIETTFLDISMSDPAGKPLVTTAATNGTIHLSTMYYKLLPIHASDLFIDLAYFHLELSGIAIKGLLPHLLELNGDDASKLSLMEREMKDEKASPSELPMRLVICQRNLLPIKSGSEASLVPGSPAFREFRTTSLIYIKSTLSKAQLLALPCASIVPTLPEVFQRGPSAKLWESLNHQNNDKFILTLASEEVPEHITHLCIWRDGRLWLHIVTTSEDQTGVPTDDAEIKGDEVLGVLDAGHQYQDTSHALSEVLLTTPPRKASNLEKTTMQSAKKRKQEEMDDSISQGIQNQVPTWRHKRSTTHPLKQVDRLSRWFPSIASDTVIGAPERHSTQLAALISPIRGVFGAEPPSDYLSSTSKCIAKLMESTENNDVSLFPLTQDVPAARRDLYKKVWRELDHMAKQTQDKTRGQEELANAIASADFRVNEEKKHAELAPVNKRRRCEEVPRDTHGRPIFPIKLGPSLQVYDLGKIVWNRPNFHSEKYIWPAGYKSRRAYASMLNSENRIFYWCEIVDDGQAPEFRLTPEDDQRNPVVGISATAVWTVVVKRVGALRIEEGGKKTFANVSGPEYFGYANPTIARLIQQLPDAEKCTKYRRQEYLTNVPPRTVDTETTQGMVPPECPVSPLGRDPAPFKMPTCPYSGEDAVQQTAPVVVSTAITHDNLEGAAHLTLEDALHVGAEEVLHSPAGANCIEEEVKPLSWIKEFRITKRLKEVGKFPGQFAGCSPGSLFNHYWSAKLRRLRRVDLDGRD